MNRKLAVDSVVFEKDQVLRVSAIRPAISQIVRKRSINPTDFKMGNAPS
jgi:hypothetical protein